MNPMMLLQFQKTWERFKNNHPKFPLFLKAVSQNGLKEGSVIEISITTAEGKNYCSNLKLSEDDMEMISQMKQLFNS